MSRRIWSRVLLSAITTIAVGAVAAPAQAATTGVAKVVESTMVEYRAGKARTNFVSVTRSGRVVTIDDKVTVKAGAGCKAVKGDKTKVRCTTKANPTRVRVYLGDRNDIVVNRTDLGITGRGDAGNDKLFGGPRGDDLNGGDGNDTLKGYGGYDHVRGQDGHDLLDGGIGDDFVEGGFGNDSLYGGDGSDTLLGMEGNDREYGGNGADRLDENSDIDGPDSDVLSGGNGDDWVSYSGRRKAVTADADGVQGDDGAKNERDSIQADVEEIYGGLGNDRLYGTSRRDVLDGGPGNDTVRGDGGNDVLTGGDGYDALYGEDGDDDLSGQEDTMVDHGDRLDGGGNATEAGDLCTVLTDDSFVNCERF